VRLNRPGEHYGIGAWPKRNVKRKPCRVDDCDAMSDTQGLCKRHHYRWKKYGTTDAPPRKRAKKVL